jgi:UDP-glucose 6-dehydrogenase
MVPGPDGDFGFGGHCFPKDLQALRFIAKQLKIDTKVLDATLSTNDEVRNNRDWERQEGRAIVNFNSKKTNSK